MGEKQPSVTTVKIAEEPEMYPDRLDRIIESLHRRQPLAGLLIPEVLRGLPSLRLPALRRIDDDITLRVMTPAEQEEAAKRSADVFWFRVTLRPRLSIDAALPRHFASLPALKDFVQGAGGMANLMPVSRIYHMILYLSDMLASSEIRFRAILRRTLGCIPDRLEFYVSWQDSCGRDGVAALGRLRGANNPLIPDPYFYWNDGYARWKALQTTDLPPWRERKPIAIWRGGTSGRRFTSENIRENPRINLVFHCRELSDIFDVKITALAQMDGAMATRVGEALQKAELLGDRMSPAAFRNFRFSIDIDGNANAWGFFEKLALGLCVLKVDSPWEQWFYPDLKPWVHYVPIDASLDDLVPTMEELRANSELALGIAENAAAFALERDIDSEAVAFCRALTQSTDSLIVDGTPLTRATVPGLGTAAFDMPPASKPALSVAVEAVPSVDASECGRRGKERVAELTFSFRRDGNATAFLVDGWSGPEATHVWSLGGTSSLCLRGVQPGADYRLTFNIAAFVAPPHISPSKFRVFAADELIGAFDLDGKWGTVACDLRKSRIGPDGQLALSFEHPDFGRPADYGHSDRRELAICFREIRLTPLRCAGERDGRSGSDEAQPPLPSATFPVHAGETGGGGRDCRIACLVLAHAAPAILAVTGALLKHAGIDTLVHLDAKDDLDAYRSEMGSSASSVTFLDKRVTVFWGGYSMLEAEFALMERALAEGYERLLLISDDTFPLIPMPQLREMLATPIDRITCDRVAEGHEFWHRYYDFWYFDHAIMNPRTRGGGGYPPTFDDKFMNAMEEMLDLKRRGKALLTLHYGSTFWCLRAETARRLLDYRSNAHICSSFRFAAQTDELMFPSILGTFMPDLPRTKGPVFADFTRPPGPLRYRRYVDLPGQVPPHAAFIRKIAPDAGALARDMADRLTAGESILTPPVAAAAK